MAKSNNKKDSDWKEHEAKVEGYLERITTAIERLVKVDTIYKWMRQYDRLETAVSDDALASFKIMMEEFVIKEYALVLLHREGADGFEMRLKRLLIKQRTYEYLLAVHNFEGIFPDGDDAIRRWIRELCWVHDFRVIHARQGGYYPSFAKVVSVSSHSSIQSLTRLRALRDAILAC